MAFTPIASEMLTLKGHNGDEIEAYYARPLGDGPFPGVVVIHHMPGWDEWTSEVVRKLAHHGYAAICAPPLLPLRPRRARTTSRPRSAPPAASRTPRSWATCRPASTTCARSPTPTARSASSASAPAAARPTSPPAAAGHRRRRRLLGRRRHRRRPGAANAGAARGADRPTRRTSRLPLLGIFGNDDANPDPEQVNRTEAELKRHGKTYEFHRYDGAGHGFFAVDRPGYRPEQADDAWAKVFAFYEKHLGAAAGVK